MSIMTDTVSAMKEAEKVIDGLMRQNERLREALRHQITRTHAFSHACDACAAAFHVTEQAYQEKGGAK